MQLLESSLALMVLWYQAELKGELQKSHQWRWLGGSSIAWKWNETWKFKTSQTRNPKVFLFGKTGNCGFWNKMCSLGSQPLHLCEWSRARHPWSPWLQSAWHLPYQCPTSTTQGGQKASSATPSFSCQPGRRHEGFNSELPGLQAAQVQD